MGLITDKNEVLEIYEEAAQHKWVIPCICCENLTTIEAVLASVKEYGDKIGVNNLPITIAITNCYEHRHQTINYTFTKNWEVGMRLFIEDLKILTSTYSPFKDLRVMLHLDHIQHDIDSSLLNWDMKQFSSIMFDASTLNFDENIITTRKFVEKHSHEILIEGACDEIIDAGSGGNELTSPEKAERYMKETGCDFIVANLGTEHRASVSELKYHGDLAEKIKSKIGTKLVLHGASSVESQQITNLFEDGVCKVNIWTILERESSAILFPMMLQNASRILGFEQVVELQKQGILGENISINSEKSIDYYTTLYRQHIIFDEMKKIVTGYLNIWYI